MSEDRSLDPLEMLTDNEVCALLRISPSTWRVWRKAGKTPPCYSLGDRGARTRRADLEAWIEARLVKGQSP